jgi:hypothetical protein
MSTFLFLVANKQSFNQIFLDKGKFLFLTKDLEETNKIFGIVFVLLNIIFLFFLK